MNNLLAVKKTTLSTAWRQIVWPIFRACKNIFTLLTFAFFINACNADSTFHGNIWSIRKIDDTQKDKVFYILGTVHKTKNQHVQLSEKILKVISTSGAFLLESDRLDSAAIVANISRPSLIELKNVASGEVLLQLRTYLARKNATNDQIEKLLSLHPLAVYFFLDSLPTINSFNSSLSTQSDWIYPGIDLRLKDIGILLDKKVVYLETVSEFLNSSHATCNEKVYYSELIKLRIDALLGLDTRQDFTQLASAIFEGNIQFIENWYSTDNNFSDEIKLWKKCNIEPRNRAWLVKIDSFYSNHKSGLVAVGFDHLMGENGLINLLRQRGYVVSSVL